MLETKKKTYFFSCHQSSFFVPLTRVQRCGSPKAGAFSEAVQSAAKGTASGAPAGPHGAVPLRRDHRALRLPAVLLIQQGGAVWVSDTEGGHTQGVAVTVLEEQRRDGRLMLSMNNLKTITVTVDQVQHNQDCSHEVQKLNIF